MIMKELQNNVFLALLGVALLFLLSGSDSGGVVATKVVSLQVRLNPAFLQKRRERRSTLPDKEKTRSIGLSSGSLAALICSVFSLCILEG